LYPAIDNPASCAIRSVVRFLHAKYMSAVQSHRKLRSAVYGRNVMSEGTVRIFKDGRTNVHDEERSGRLSVMSDNLV
jgi:hypothetical protein